MLSESFADYDSGQYSPQYLSLSDLEPGTLITNEEDDEKRLAFARLQVQQGSSNSSQVCSVEIFEFIQIVFITKDDGSCQKVTDLHSRS